MRQRHLAAGIQRRFATLARKEGLGHQRQAARDTESGNQVLARFHQTEADRDMFWYHRRLRSAGQYLKKR
jgi:hypothetical protein